jgi:hypothetical protein
VLAAATPGLVVVTKDPPQDFERDALQPPLPIARKSSRIHGAGSKDAVWLGLLPGLAPLLEGGSDPLQVTSGLITVHQKFPLEFVKLIIR